MSHHWQELLEEFRAHIATIPYWQLLGAQVEEVGEGYACISLPLDPRLNNSDGSAHGGALASLVDMAVARALRTLYDGTIVGHATVELNISFLRPARGQRLTAEGRILRLGSTVAVGEVQVGGDDGRLVATGRATYMIFRRKE